MTVQDSPALPALPDRARRFRWGYFGVRALLVVLVLAFAAFLPGGKRGGDRLHYREGDIARERVVAPYDFRVEKDEAALRREQAQAAAAVPPVFVVDAARRGRDAEADGGVPGEGAGGGAVAPTSSPPTACGRCGRWACR